jgi:nucleotide-binding universal stress UspA family protein
MTSATLNLHARSRIHGSPARHVLTGPLLVAGRDDESTRGALRIAEILARRDRVNAHVLSVVPPLPYTASLLEGIDPAAIENARRSEQLARVRRRVHQTVGRSAHFSTGAEVGSPASAIARSARDRGAALVLVGLGGHHAAARASTEDTALNVARMAGVAVLAVPPGYAVLPRRTVVAVDFSEASMRAARTALLTLAVGSKLTLVHVKPDLGLRDVGNEAWHVVYREGVVRLFRRFVQELRAPDHVKIQTTIIEGDPSTTLLEAASRSNADLIAVGSRSVSQPDLDLTGSVSAALLRGATCGVLIAPSSTKREPEKANTAA